MRGSTEPSGFCTYLMVSWVLPSGRSHQQVPSLRTSVKTLPSLVAIRWVRGMHDSVSSEAYPNMMPWSPAPTSRSDLPTCTPPAMSGDCLLMRTRTSHESHERPLDLTDERSSSNESKPIFLTSLRTILS